jgi:uncharacterized membrane protein YkvA (DUF1232 family)
MNWKEKAGQLKTELHALAIAYGDARTPWYAKAWALIVLAYAFSPIDLIPDFIPVLGYLDDAILLPLGILLALKLIPPEVMDAARLTAAQSSAEKRIGWIGAGLIAAVYLALTFCAVRLVLYLIKR